MPQSDTHPYSDHKNTCPDTRTHLTHALSGLHNALHGFWRELPDNNTITKPTEQRSQNKQLKQKKKIKNKNVDSPCIATGVSRRKLNGGLFLQDFDGLITC